MLGNRPMSDWIAQYSTSHQHPVNRLCHTFGIPLIVVSIVMALAGFWWPTLWVPAAIVFVVGWVLQFIGHWFEGSTGYHYKYIWEVDDHNVQFWLNDKQSNMLFQGEFSEDGNTISGTWKWPGGGYHLVMKRAIQGNLQV